MYPKDHMGSSHNANEGKNNVKTHTISGAYDMCLLSQYQGVPPPPQPPAKAKVRSKTGISRGGRTQTKRPTGIKCESEVEHTWTGCSLSN